MTPDRSSSYPLPPAARLSALRASLPAALDPDVAPPPDVTIGERYALASAFVGHLIERHGTERWSSVVRELILQPTEWRPVFKRQLGESFEGALAQFERSLIRRRAPVKAQS